MGTTVAKVTESLTLPNPEYAASRRFAKGRFFRKVPTHICYLKVTPTGEFILPRYYFGEAGIKDHGFPGATVKFDCWLKLRDYQEKFFDENLSSMLSETGRLLELPCGHGKTSLSIYISWKLCVQTLVLVPTYFLAKQWAAAIKRITNATVTVVSSKDTAMPLDSHFTIVVLDLFTLRDFPKEFTERIGHVILDEAHRLGAETYLPILEAVPAMHRTALTATFRRADGVHRILKFHFGRLYHMDSQFPPPSVYAIPTGVKLKGALSKNNNLTELLPYMDMKGIPYHETPSALNFDPNFFEMLDNDLEKKRITKTAYLRITRLLKKTQAMAYSTIDSYLNEHSGRRKLTIQIIQAALDEGRTILFLSKRKNVLKALAKVFDSYRPCVIISETKERTDAEEAYLQDECRIIFGVTQLAKEGLDVDRLDTLIIHLPMKDAEQPLGRIARLHPLKKSPVAIYLLDDHPIMFGIFWQMKKSIKANSTYGGEVNLWQLRSIFKR